jgi:hypothetical protein
VEDGSESCPFHHGFNDKQMWYQNKMFTLVQLMYSFDYDHIKSKMGGRKKRQVNRLKRKADRDEERQFCEPRCCFCHRWKTSSCKEYGQQKSVPQEN